MGVATADHCARVWNPREMSVKYRGEHFCYLVLATIAL